MEDSRKLAHLSEQLGDERFQVLISSDNTGKVKEFCDALLKLKDAIPTTMTVGGRTYDILDFLREDKTCVKGDVMVNRAVEMDANLGEDDGRHILRHQDEIPVALRKVVFVFTDWHHPDNPENVYYVYCHGGCWVRHWRWLDDDWRGSFRVLRRK